MPKQFKYIILCSVIGIAGLLLTNAESSAVYGEIDTEAYTCSGEDQKVMEDINTLVAATETGSTEAQTEFTTAEITTQETTEPPTEITTEDMHVIDNFPLILQMPELPTGCEVTAAAMVLNYYGFNADKVLVAEEYLPTTSRNLHYGADGRLYGSDLNEYFIGDPKTEAGYVCGTGAITTALNSYLADQGSSLQARDLSGSSPQELYVLVKNDTPVIVWVTISMNNRYQTQGWYTDSGEYVEWSTNDHGAVLIGYDETTVTIADPISGLVTYNKSRFESVFAARGNKCVIME